MFRGTLGFSLYRLVYRKTNMAAVARRFLVGLLRLPCLKKSDIRATIHTTVSRATTHKDPLVGICFLGCLSCYDTTANKRALHLGRTVISDVSVTV